MAPLVESGQVVSCTVTKTDGSRGRPGLEYRLAAGAKVAEFKALDTRRAGIAQPGFRGARELPPIPKTLPPVASYEAIQRMTADEFGEYIKHLSRVWGWNRPQKAAA